MRFTILFFLFSVFLTPMHVAAQVAESNQPPRTLSPKDSSPAPLGGIGGHNSVSYGWEVGMVDVLASTTGASRASHGASPRAVRSSCSARAAGTSGFSISAIAIQ